MDAREKLNEFSELRGWDKNKLIGWSEAADFGEWLVKNCSTPAVSGRYLSAEKAKQMASEALKEMAAKEHNTKCVLEKIEEAAQEGEYQIKTYNDNRVRDNLVFLGYDCSEPFQSRDDIYMMVSWL